MRSVAPVFVQDLLHRRSCLPRGQLLAQLSQPRQPCLTACRWHALWKSTKLGHWPSLVGDDHLFALLDQVDQFQQVGLCLFQRCLHGGIQPPWLAKSTSPPGTAHAQWVWAGLGVPLVFQGHTHERGPDSGSRDGEVEEDLNRFARVVLRLGTMLKVPHGVIWLARMVASSLAFWSVGRVRRCRRPPRS